MSESTDIAPMQPAASAEPFIAVVSELRIPSQPYPGLRPFSDSEAGIFFGRDRHRNRLLGILQKERFLAVVGPSGSGKSSLVRAGLLPALPLGAVGTGHDWIVLKLRPGNKPLRNLAKELLQLNPFSRALSDGNSSEDATDVTRVESALRSGPQSLVDLVVAAKANAQCNDRNVLVLVDQFEELFTYAEAGGQQADESDAFVNLLLAARDVPDALLFVAITMRTDFLGHCVRFLGLPEAMNRAQYLTPRLTREEIREVICQPAWCFGGSVEAPLVEELINAAQKSDDQLPILQHALARMWELATRRDPKRPCIVCQDLKDVGGVDGALSKHGEEMLLGMTASERRDAEWMLRAITAERSVDGGGQRIRRPQTLKRIAEWSDRPQEAFLPIIATLSQPTANFVTYPGQPNAPEDGENTVIDLSHESLMRQWTTLAQWVGSEVACAAEYERLYGRMADERANSGSLLTGGDLERARAWLQRGLQLGANPREPGSGNGAPTARWAARYDRGDSHRFRDVVDFVRRSNRREKWSKYGLYSLVAAVVLASLGMGLFGYTSYLGELKRQVEVLWAEIRVESINDGLTEPALEKLFDVAQADAKIRHRFGEAGVSQAELQPSLVVDKAIVARAAVALDENFSHRLASEVRKMPVAGKARDPVLQVAMLAALDDSRIDDWKQGFAAPLDENQRKALLNAFSSILPGLPASTRSEWAGQLITPLRAQDQNADAGFGLAKGLARLAPYAPSAEVGNIAFALQDNLQRSRDLSLRRELASDVGGIASLLTPADLETLVLKWERDAEAPASKDVSQMLATEMRAIFASMKGTGDGPHSVFVKVASAPGFAKSAIAMDLFASAVSNATSIDSTAARGWAEFLLRDAPSNLSATALALAAKVIEKETMQFTIATAQLYAKATEEQRRTWKPVFAAESRDLKILSDSATPGRRPAASGIDGVLALIGATSDPDDLKDYGSDLAKAVSRAPIVQSEAIFARLLQLRNSTFDSDQRAALLQGMLAAVDRFPPHSRMAQFQNGCCAWAAQFRSDPEAVQSLVGRLVSGMDSTEAYELGHRTIEVLGKSEAISPKNDAYGDTKSLVQGPIVVAVSGRVSADPALLQKWTTELESLQAKKPPRGVSDLVMQALAVTASSQPNDDDQLSKLFDILLEGAERAPLQTVDRTWRANRQALLSRVSSGDDEDRNVDCNASSPPQPPISVGLCVIAARLSDRTAMDWLQKLTKRHIESPTVKRRILVALIVNRRLEVLVSMQGTLLESMIHDTRRPELRTTKAAYMIISERQDVAIRSRFTMDVARGLLLLKAGDGAQARVLSEMLSGMIVARKAVSDSITPDAALAGLLVEACKLPYVDRVKVAAAIRRGEPNAPPESEGLARFLRWAVERYEIAVEAPPGLPRS